MKTIAPLAATPEDYGKVAGTVGKAASLLAKNGLLLIAWQRLIDDAAMRQRLVRSWNAGGIVSLDQTLEYWAKLYQDDFGSKVDLNKLVIPPYRYGFSRLIVVAKGVTPNRVYDVCANNFSCWRFTDDLDAAVKGRNDREPITDYMVWVRDRVEADGELKNLSADQLKDQNVPGITLLERILLELKFFAETGEHLDRSKITLCIGSRDSAGGVPYAFWRKGKFRVRGAGPGCADAVLRARQVVS